MIITKKDFCMHIEEQFATTNMSMIDSVIVTCDTYNVDPELVEPLINRSVREKMKNEYIELNYMKLNNVAVI